MPDFVTDYGAPTNGKYRNDVALTIALGGTTLTAGTAIFTDGASEIGKLICYRNHDPLNSSIHISQITGFTSSTVVTIQDPSPFAMSAHIKPIAWGSSCDAAVTAWWAACDATDGLTLTIPAGVFVVSGPHSLLRSGRNCNVVGAGPTLTRFNQMNISTGITPTMNHGSVVRVHTANAGDTFVTAKDSILLSRLTVGNYVCVTGISTQANYGFPPTFQQIEYHKITSIVGSQVNLDGALRFDYLETWPELDSVPITITGTGGADAVIHLPEHGFNGVYPTGFTQFFLDTNGIGTMPGGLEGQEGTSTVPGTTWQAIIIDADNFKFTFQGNPPVSGLTSVGSGVVLHRSGVEQAGPACIYPMESGWDVEQTISGITVDPNVGINPGYARKLTLDGINLPGGYGPTVTKTFIHKNSIIGRESGECEIDKMIEEIFYDNCTIEQLFYQNASVSTITNSSIGFLNGCGNIMIADNCHFGALGQGIAGSGLNTFNQFTNCIIDSVTGAGTTVGYTYVEFEPIPSDPTRGRFKIKLFAGNPYLNPRRFNVMAAFLPGGWYQYAWSGPNMIGFPFQIISYYNDSVYAYFDTSLPVPQPNPDIFGGTGNPFLSHVQLEDGGTFDCFYIAFTPTQIAVSDNTGADPTFNAHEIIPVQTVGTNPAPVTRARIRVR